MATYSDRDQAPRLSSMPAHGPLFVAWWGKSVRVSSRCQRVGAYRRQAVENQSLHCHSSHTKRAAPKEARMRLEAGHSLCLMPSSSRLCVISAHSLVSTMSPFGREIPQSFQSAEEALD